MVYIAHIREADKKIQPVKDHLLGVKHLAETFGAKLQLKHVAGLAGLLHDLGKYSDEFQQYIYEAVYTPDDAKKKRGDVDHATYGGKLLFSLFHDKNKNSQPELLLTEIVGNAIISHHSNLHDYISPKSQSGYLNRVKHKELPEFPKAVERFFDETISKASFAAYVKKATSELEEFTDYTETQSFFLTKYIFSCLVDADRTDTRLFEEDKKVDQHFQPKSLFSMYYKKLINKLNEFKMNPNANHPINVLRQEMSVQCEMFADKPSGIFTLSIPTGGGKTLASLRYALKHAQKYNKQRIIYIVPFTTIIEQNAEEIRNILEDDEHILEHHSNVIEEESDDEQDDGLLAKKHKLKLARDNWDSPIIFTTMVQFLNVFYAKGNRNTRRLHNLSHATLIFDEVQKVPIKYISLFNEALNFLKNNMSSSILLCTATQPTLENVQHSLLKDRDGEIIDNLQAVSESFKRVDIIDETNQSYTNDQLVTWIKADIGHCGSTLVILNTKTVVKDLYKKLKEAGVPVYHLSTSMCAAHRKDQLIEIRRKLKDDVSFVCVTTQLIEAGVDVSFKRVIRSMAGLDSIAQAAGRCNRHGEVDQRDVYVVDHAEERLSKLKEIKEGKQITKNILAMYKKKPNIYDNNLLSGFGMREYFHHFYQKMDSNLNYYIPKVDKDMTMLLMGGRKDNEYVAHYRKKMNETLPLCLTGSYKTAAEHFQAIDQATTSILVPYGEGKEIIVSLNSDDRSEELSNALKKAQQFTVNVYSNALAELKRENALVMHLDGAFYELRENWYSDEYGLDLMGEGAMGDLIL
ncbi:CRISPR-associated helicase Cas3' [Paraliobacillus sp. JSM ZJ581]|uniref:CRISPR-associated helicase Cas3' n=1 Tax=Paraliobacillus sp. JSM ZJ581 TaxID=3342118 RepID=UPI0035A97BA5